MFKPRPKQQEVLDYTGGKMGVAAVPGSGKTRTLSALTAKLVASRLLDDDQEVLVVTLVNSAVDNFSRQVGEFVRERGLLPGFGYRVRTLHGLSNDIVRERPGLVGLSDDFTIVDEREASEIMQDAVTSWVRSHPDAAEDYLNAELDDNRREYIKRDNWPDQVLSLANAFIRQAKDWELEPDDIRTLLDERDDPLPLVEMCHEIYVNYQRGLSYRGAVDFQDLIRLALKALQQDADYLKRLRHRWPFVLEDEAQDSSLLQERILRTLVGSKGNWVRVGDPNQSIYETFTTAKPEYLRNFLDEMGVTARELPNSGRSTLSIIALANALIDWTIKQHPMELVRRRAPLQTPYIQPSPPGDPQPNPPDQPDQIFLYKEALSPQEEISMVVRSLQRWLPQNPDKTAAVLVPRNRRGFEIVDALKALREPPVEYVELLRSTTTTREAAGALGNILNYLAGPGSPNLLATAFRVWRREDRDDPLAAQRNENVTKLLRGCKRVEDYLWPDAGNDWLDGVNDPDLHELMDAFRHLIRRWQRAVTLPIDQLILTLAGDLFRNSVDLALAHSIAVFLRRSADTHPDWRLPQFTDELAVVARNERKFLGLSEDDSGFDPDKHKGKVTVATIHAAKGLEWDRVYLLSVNNYDFPSAQPYDQYISEKWYVRDGLNLEAEGLAQLAGLYQDTDYAEGLATRDARLDYTSERLRLLYVGVTRARRELIITWNTGRQGDLQPALPFVALQSLWDQRQKKQ
ncbi:MAG: ATP-dependent helicase [Anaerolineae bacterium]|nr:ATP-dependent helicase [Anaerolineae bacterium]